ncbi:MAG: hypothetical protein R3242_01270 [Akkermansiaceae bacterium]|nr:hypothetical protein [Akkermansiaceae bacterium]
MKAPILALAVLSISVLIPKAEELPLDVERVLHQLKEFEANERAKAEVVIADKRLEVVKFLESALTRETKAGKLESALLIKKKIESLSPEPAADQPAKPSLGGNRDFYGEWTWFIPDQTLILEKGNKAFIQLPGGGAKLEAKWQSAGDRGRTIVVNWGNNEARIKFDPTYETGDIKGKNGGHEFDTELKRIR